MKEYIAAALEGEGYIAVVYNAPVETIPIKGSIWQVNYYEHISKWGRRT